MKRWRDTFIDTHIIILLNLREIPYYPTISMKETFSDTTSSVCLISHVHPWSSVLVFSFFRILEERKNTNTDSDEEDTYRLSRSSVR